MNHQTTGTNLKKKPQLFYGYKIVVFCYITAIIVWGTFNSFGVFFDSLLNEFHWTRAATSGAFSLCTVISGLAAIPLGRITDRFGPRRVMTACSLVLGAGYILMALIDSIWQFYLIYGIIIADGSVDTSEMNVFESIASSIGVTASDARSMKSMFIKSTDWAYEVLEIKRDASPEQIKRAYRQLALKNHPDRVAYLGEEIRKKAKACHQSLFRRSQMPEKKSPGHENPTFTAW